MMSRLRCRAAALVLALLLTACAQRDGIWSEATRVASEPEVAITAPGDAALHAWPEAKVMTIALAEPLTGEAQDGRYLLDTGDKLRIFVYGQPSLSRLYTVDHGGWITVPLIGAVKARGLTTFDLERVIRSRLAGQFVKDPQVTVDIQQNRPFFILGEVKNAGQYPYVSGMTVKTAVAIAGGYTERANERLVQITRRRNGAVERFDAPDDFLVQPGDTLQVYERFL
jgi:polysaccharide export outer membrane protein